MFVLYGSRSDTVDFGPGENKRCPKCGKDAPFHLVLNYRFYHLFYEIGAVVEKRHYSRCASCGALQPTQPPPGVNTSSRIPLQRRFGLYAWLIFAMAVAVPYVIQEYARLLK